MALDGKKPDYTLLYLELENELSGNYNYSDFKSIVDSVKPIIKEKTGQVVKFSTADNSDIDYKKIWENKE